MEALFAATSEIFIFLLKCYPNWRLSVNKWGQVQLSMMDDGKHSTPTPVVLSMSSLKWVIWRWLNNLGSIIFRTFCLHVVHLVIVYFGIS